MVTCNATISTLYEQGQASAILAWKYRDDNTGVLIDPVSVDGRLFDVNDAQWTPTDTSIPATGTFTPTKDADGSVTGTAGAYYVQVNFDENFAIGKGYVKTTYTHESKTRVRNICFFVLESGASVSTDEPIATPNAYCGVGDVENLLMMAQFVDEHSTPPKGVLEDFIVRAEGDFEAATGKSFKPVMVSDEIHDVEAWRQRHRELLNEEWITSHRPIKLNHNDILPFDTSRGHKIEVYEGSETDTSPSEPIRRWSDWTQDKTYGRTGDYWFDAEKGILYVRKTFLFRRGSLFRITYEYGKPITTLGTAINSTVTTIPVLSTYKYQARGVVRIGNEYVHHTGKTQTSFTGCSRGVFNTQAEAHLASSEVYEIPDDIRGLVAKRAAALFLQNDVYTANVGDGGLSSPSIESKVTTWNQEWEKFISNRYQRIEVF